LRGCSRTCREAFNQHLFDIQETILKANWRDPRLHLKKLGGKPVMFSFRITRAYRAVLYLRASDEITLFAVGHRKDIYRKLRNK